MTVLQVNSITVRGYGDVILKDLSFTINEHQQWAIVGPSGSGKTSLLHALQRSGFTSGNISVSTINNIVPKMILVEQQHHFKNLSNTSNFYYQQRFNSSDSEDAITVNEALTNCLSATEKRLALTAEADHIVDLLRLRKLLEVKLIQLSNGENKRLQIAQALLLDPTILLLDNPFTGLDVEARKVLSDLLIEVIKKRIHIILVSSPHHLPDFITHVLSLDKDGSYAANDVESYRQKNLLPNTTFSVISETLLKEMVRSSGNDEFKFAVRMNHVNVAYNNRRILKDITWEVRKGECWCLSGPNGSGKSTLLSLVNADNPQAYANEIYLFDRKRGTGETIWEIKKKIGFVSPELHLFFDTTITCFDVVASGLFDTIGLFRYLNERQSAIVTSWMKLLHIEHSSQKLLSRLPNSEQRLVLLARALVKNPPLLILDEPCQGLDEDQVTFFRKIVDDICTLTGKTLIYVSHYTQEIPACVTKFLRLEHGNVS